MSETTKWALELNIDQQQIDSPDTAKYSRNRLCQNLVSQNQLNSVPCKDSWHSNHIDQSWHTITDIFYHY